MTAEEIKDKAQEIVNELNMAGGIASVFVPQYAAFIAIGKAMSQFIPGLAETVTRWIDGEEPTEDEVKDMLSKLAVLANPDLP